MNEVVDPLHEIPGSHHLSGELLVLFSKVLPPPYGQSGSFVLPAVMAGIGIALLSQSTLTHRLQWTNYASEPGVRGTFFRAILQSIKL